MKNLVPVIILLVCLIAPATLNSTCIFIAIAPSGIYVVADTRSNAIIPSKEGKVIAKWADTLQKIHNVGDIYFAVSGNDDRMLSKLASGINPKISIMANAKIFAEKMKVRYKKSMNVVKGKLWNQDYKWWLSNSLADVAFFTKRNDKPIMLVVEFVVKFVKGKPNVNYSITETNVAILGIRDHIEKISIAEKMKLRGPSQIETMKNLVKYELNYHRDEISCPLDILVWETKPILKREQCK